MGTKIVDRRRWLLSIIVKNTLTSGRGMRKSGTQIGKLIPRRIRRQRGRRHILRHTGCGEVD